MRNVITSLIVTTALMLGSASAQGGGSDTYAGVSVKAGFISDICMIFSECGGVSFGVAAHVGAHGLLGAQGGLRGTLGATFAHNIAYFQLAANALYEPGTGALPVAPYFGGGLRVGLMSRAPLAQVGSITPLNFGLGVVGGARFQASQSVTLFAEAGLDLLLTSGLVPSLAVGAEFGL